jgi:hypothetical protein
MIAINLVTTKAGAIVQQTGHRPLDLPAPAPVEMPRAAKAIFFPKPIAAIMEKRLYDQPEKTNILQEFQYLALATKILTYIPVGGNQPTGSG